MSEPTPIRSMKRPSEVTDLRERQPATVAAAPTTEWAQELIWSVSALKTRSTQANIGPSEVGDPCDRSVASKLLGLPPVRMRGGGSMSSIAGSGIHDWLADGITALYGPTFRYLIETRVEYRGISGSCDLYDRRNLRVVDWKTKSASMAKQLRRRPIWTPSQIVQTNIYGAGMIEQGERVEEVSIVIVPREGGIEDAFALVRPFERAVADAAIDRLDRLRAITPEQLAALPSCSEPFCLYCVREAA